MSAGPHSALDLLFGNVRPEEVGGVPADRRPLMLLFLCVSLASVFIAASYGFTDSEYWARMLGFLALLILVCLLFLGLFTRQGTPWLDVFTPQNFYSVFFAAFYLLPFAVILMDERITGALYVRTGIALVLALFAFLCGCKAVQGQRPRLLALDLPDAWATLSICWFSMAMFAYLYYWRLRNGNFYTHANNYVVGTDVASQLLESFVQQLYFPTLLLTGLVAASRTPVARAASASLKIFLSLSFIVFVVASQFRLAVTAMVVAWVAFHFSSEPKIRWRTVLKLSAVALAAAALIFTIRASGAGQQLAESDNQFVDLVKGITSGQLLDPAKLGQATVGSDGETSLVRAITPLMFFGEVVDALDSPSVPFGFGESFAYEISEVIPRALWKDKPDFVSTQIFIRQQLGMQAIDSSPHPLLQFYFEFGWPGIAVGFFLMGALIKFITLRQGTMFSFFIFAFVWSALIQVENGLFLNLLIFLRAAMILYVMWLAVRFFIRTSQPLARRSALHSHRHRVTAA